MKTSKEETTSDNGKSRIVEFIHGFTLNREDLNKQVSRCVIDLLGALYGGIHTKAAKIAAETAAEDSNTLPLARLLELL